MKKYFFKYPILLIAVGIISLPITLGAGSKHAVVLSVDQSKIDSTQIPQALRDFISQAIKEGLSIDQIVEQAVSQGYAKDQVVAACSVIIVQEDDTTSIHDTLMWYTLGAVVVGICGWLTYRWLTSETINRPDEKNDQNNGDIRVIDRDFQIVPVDRILSADENRRMNQIIEQGQARGVDPDNIVLEVRQAFPDIAFQGHFVRELPANENLREARRVAGFQYGPWNNRIELLEGLGF